MINWSADPHRRFNILNGEWVLVSPHRTQRPWQGQVERSEHEILPAYDPDCYLCPGNTRARGERNPNYTSTFVFENDFAALKPSTPPERYDRDGLLIAEGEPGTCRVVCFSPRHDLTLGFMDVPAIRAVVDTWRDQLRDLGSRDYINYIQIFENRGAMMGASNPHPHCQIWATRTIPAEVQKEQRSFEAWRSRHGRCLLCDYLALELELKERIVFQNPGFVILVPFWAVWPFELLLISQRHIPAMEELAGEECDHLADALRRINIRYDNLFQAPFPYTMGFHQRPSDEHPHPEWHFHAHYFPPLLRSATIRKFMVGFELLAMPQRDLTAEAAADRLRSVPEEHYRVAQQAARRGISR